MSKYDPLGSYLSNQDSDRIPMTFSEIERILGTQLPASKHYPAWWSNNTSNNVMTRQWLDAGYQTESVDIAGEKLVFSRLPHSNIPFTASTDSSDMASVSKPPESHRSPIFGCMKGTITIPDDVDLTQPADAGWAPLIEGRYP